MRNALDPITGERISPEAHAIRKEVHGKNAICGGCKAEAFDHSVGSLIVMSHFNHVADSGPCGLKGAPTIKDSSVYSDNGKALRSQFMQPDYIRLAFSICQTMVCGALKGDRFVRGNFTVSRFKELLHVADRKHTWSLKNLTPTLVPFELAAYEVFNIKYREDSDKGAAITFVLDKSPLSDSSRDRYDRSIPVNPEKPIYLIKHFLNADGTIGSRIRDLDPENPYVVSEENAIRLGGTNWARLPDRHVKCILDELKK